VNKNGYSYFKPFKIRQTHTEKSLFKVLTLMKHKINEELTKICNSWNDTFKTSMQHIFS